MRETLKKVAGEFTQRSSVEQDNDERLRKLARERFAGDSFGRQWNNHSTVFLKRQVLSRLIYQDYLYRRILDVPGIICEFGVHWGATIATLCNLRGIHEPYNHSRHIVGFDTFSGFTGIDDRDGGFSGDGDYSTSSGYEAELEEILSIHESFSPISQIKKYELVKGDVSTTFMPWLASNPHAVIAMAIFDMDIYKPTRDALEAVIPRLTRGSMLVFDELNCRHFPGETEAVNEVIGFNNLRLERFPHQPFCAFAMFEG